MCGDDMDIFLGILGTVFACVIGWYLLLLIFALFLLGFKGAGNLFSYASEQGFIGLAVCLACFVFMFPIMVIVSIAVGYFTTPVKPEPIKYEGLLLENSQTSKDYIKQEKDLIKKIELRRTMDLDVEDAEEELHQLRESKIANVRLC
jgi:hypothetical protein